MLGLAGVLIVAGWRIAQIRMDIPYTGLEIPIGYAYAAVPIAAYHPCPRCARPLYLTPQLHGRQIRCVACRTDLSVSASP
jgi:hypothetical protein